MTNETIRVLGIAGSPRRQGNTEILLDRFLAAAAQAGGQTSKIVAAQLDLSACVSCGVCDRQGHCAMSDDFEGVNEQLVRSDVIAIATPLYFWNVPAQLKALIDRGQVQWHRKIAEQRTLAASAAGRSRRRGVLIAVGGHPRGYFEGTVRTVKSFFRLYETDYWGKLLRREIDGKGEINDHPEALQQAEALGRGVVTEPWTDKK